MDLSQYNSETRNRLYYNKYKYKCVFYLKGVSRIRYCKSYDHFLNRMEDLLVNYNYKPLLLPDKQDYHKFEKIFNFIPTITDPHTFRIEGNHASYFTNDPNAITELVKNLEIENKSEYYVCNVNDPNVILLANPKYQYRCYLKSRRVENNFKKDLISLFEAYKSQINPCKALYNWADKHNQTRYYSNYSSGSHYIEYNDEKMLLFLQLHLGSSILGKVYKLEKRL